MKHKKLDKCSITPCTLLYYQQIDICLCPSHPTPTLMQHKDLASTSEFKIAS